MANNVSFANRVKVYTNTVGTGNVSIGSAFTGFQTFANSGLANNSLVSYVIEDAANNQIWEIGRGTYNNDTETFERNVIIESSNSNNAISLSGNSALAVTILAQDIWDGNQYKSENFTGYGNTGPYILNSTPLNNDNCWVYLDGLYQDKTRWTLSSNQIVLSNSIPNTVNITVNYVIGNLKSQISSRVTNTHIGTNSVGPFQLLTTPVNSESIDIYVDGVYQPKDGSAYTISGANITFSESISNTSTWDEIHYPYVAIGVPSANTVGASELKDSDQVNIRTKLGLFYLDIFDKSDKVSPAFYKSSNTTIHLKGGTTISVYGNIYNYTSNTAITMPTLNDGTDYAIWIKPDGSLEATTNFSLGPVSNSRNIGGFHYAPGGNATAQSGGDTTPQINQYSIWDLKFRPSCNNPRGMALISNNFWCDIYLLGVDHYTNGTSKYNVTIANGSSPPKVPANFGGNGSTAYSSLTWWEASEVMQSHGKDLLSYAEFAAAMYGTTENSSGGTDPVSTILRQAYTSKWGVMLATGNLWIWGRDFGGDHAAAAWANTNGGRGQVYMQSNVVVLGGHWADAVDSGSRASSWAGLPSNGFNTVGARGRCDHMCIL